MRIKIKHKISQLFECVLISFVIILSLSCNSENTNHISENKKHICKESGDQNIKKMFNINENELKQIFGRYIYKSKDGRKVILDIKEDGYYKQIAIGKDGTKYESAWDRWEFDNNYPPNRMIIFYNFCELVDYKGNIFVKNSECPKFYGQADYNIERKKSIFRIPIHGDCEWYFIKF